MRILGLLLTLTNILISGFSGYADVSFRFAANSIDEGGLKTRMEGNVSALLTEINRAANDRDLLNLSEINMEQTAKERLIAFWQDSPFVCDKSTNISKCLHDFLGYQVRAIPITMKPQNSSYDQSLNRELTVSLNKNGVITGVRPAWELNEDVNKILATTGAGGVMETRMRREILKWIEGYRLLYFIKDLDGITNIINASSLIEIQNNEKEQLLSGLRKMLTREDFSTEIDYISLLKSGLKLNIYGLTFHQKFSTSNYSDAGWFFFMWDFNDPEKPQIHITALQSDEEVAKNGVFSLEDFFIP